MQPIARLTTAPASDIDVQMERAVANLCVPQT